MTQLPSSCVVDASIGIKLFVPDQHSEAVQALFEQSALDPQSVILVPDLFFIECTNILWKMVQFANYPKESAKANIADLRALDLPATPTYELIERALEIACSHGVTAYDACYITLAEKAQLPLLTADERLVSKLAGSHFNVVTLAVEGDL